MWDQRSGELTLLLQAVHQAVVNRGRESSHQIYAQQDTWPYATPKTETRLSFMLLICSSCCTSSGILMAATLPVTPIKTLFSAINHENSSGVEHRYCQGGGGEKFIKVKVQICRNWRVHAWWPLQLLWKEMESLVSLLFKINSHQRRR